MEISKKIKELREEKQISQYQLALALQLPRYILSNIEQGRTEPNLDYLVKLANFFGVTTDELLGREDYGTGNVVVQGTALTEDEKQLLELYRALPIRDKAELVGFAKGLAF